MGNISHDIPNHCSPISWQVMFFVKQFPKILIFGGASPQAQPHLPGNFRILQPSVPMDGASGHMENG